jgi:hypothetical protein
MKQVQQVAKDAIVILQVEAARLSETLMLKPR